MIRESEIFGDRLFEIVKICASLPSVRYDVLQNHDDNQWWPLAIDDWRLRLVVAGWSTRISYNMISTYQAVIYRTQTIGYDRLCTVSDEELASIVAPLGLVHSRVEYFRAVHNFLNQSGIEKMTIVEANNDELIELLAESVKGAGYKVAQCAILYAKGYHCGIFPVDSGMKDMLGPCIGFELPKGALAHNVMRKQIEHLLNARSTDYLALVHQLGYGHLNFPENQAPIWWAHLVLIYFKRRYCNKQAWNACPLRGDRSIGVYIGTMCDRHNTQPGINLLSPHGKRNS
jgi:endonuclease III-like uncharacterized protein